MFVFNFSVSQKSKLSKKIMIKLEYKNREEKRKRKKKISKLEYEDRTQLYSGKYQPDMKVCPGLFTQSTVLAAAEREGSIFLLKVKILQDPALRSGR